MPPGAQCVRAIASLAHFIDRRSFWGRAGDLSVVAASFKLAPQEEAPMGAGTWTLAWLMLTAGAAAPEVSYISQRDFKIPIRIDPARRSEIQELLLFYSTDQGKVWQQTGAAKPDKDGFPFSATTDGLHWFSVVIVDQQGGRIPADVYTAPPGQKIFVDTLKPVLRIPVAERNGDEIVVRWTLEEPNPDLAT